MAQGSLRHDHVHIARRQHLLHAQHQFRRLLQVGRHDGKKIATPVRHANAHGRKGAKVPRQQHQGRAQPAGRQALAQHVVTAVGTAVDHEHDLQRAGQRLVHALQGLQKLQQRIFVPVDRNHQAQHGASR